MARVFTPLARLNSSLDQAHPVAHCKTNGYTVKYSIHFLFKREVSLFNHFCTLKAGLMLLRCMGVVSMFVLSKWQCVALPTRWRASVHALFKWSHIFLAHTTNISWKVCAPSRDSASRAPNNVVNCHLNKTNMDKTSMYAPLLNVLYPYCMCLRFAEHLF